MARHSSTYFVQPHPPAAGHSLTQHRQGDQGCRWGRVRHHLLCVSGPQAPQVPVTGLCLSRSHTYVLCLGWVSSLSPDVIWETRRPSVDIRPQRGHWTGSAHTHDGLCVMPMTRDVALLCPSSGVTGNFNDENSLVTWINRLPFAHVRNGEWGRADSQCRRFSIEEQSHGLCPSPGSYHGTVPLK